MKGETTVKLSVISVCSFVFLFSIGFYLGLFDKAVPVEAQKITDVPFVPSDERTEKRCLNGKCEAVMYGGPPVFVKDKNGVLRNQTDVLNMITNESGIFVSDDNGNIAIGDVIVTDDKGNEKKLKDYKNDERAKDSKFNAQISKLTTESEKAAQHFAIELSDKKSSLDKIKINWTKISPLIHIDYGDLSQSNFTVKHLGSDDVEISGFDNFSIKNSSFIDPIIWVGNETALPRTMNGTWMDTGSGDHAAGLEFDATCRLRQTPNKEACLYWVNFTGLAFASSTATINNATFYVDTSAFTATATVKIRNISNNFHVQFFRDNNSPHPGSPNNIPPGFYANSYNSNACGKTGGSGVFNSSCSASDETTVTVDASGVYGFNITNIVISTKGTKNTLAFYFYDDGTPNVQFNGFNAANANVRPRLYLDYTLAGPPPPPPVVIESPLTWFNNSRTIFVNDSYRNLSVNITSLNVSGQGNFTQINTTELRATRTIEALTFIENAVSLASKYLQLSGGTLTGILFSQTISPSSDLSYDLGSNTLRFRNVWAQFINATGNLTASSIYENGNRFPQTTGCGGTNKIRAFASDGTFDCAEDIGNTVVTKLCDAKNCTVTGMQSGYNVTVWAKGVYDGPANPQQVRLFQNTTLVDQNQVDTQTAADADSFALIHYMTTNSSNDVTYIVNSTAGTLNNTKIMIQVAR